MTTAIADISFQSTNAQNLCCTTKPAFNSPFRALSVRPLPVGDPNYYTATNYPTEVWNQPRNSAIQQMEGWDFEANYRFSL